MKPSQSYIELKKALDDDIGLEAESSASSVPEFLMRCLLGARQEADLPSNEQGFDEDVNVYLVGLLQRFLSSGYHEEAARYHYATDMDMAADLARTGDDRHRYRVYRSNADHLLLDIGLFKSSIRSRPHLAAFERRPEDLIGRGETYYGMASSSLRRLYRRRTGTEEALEKLAQHFSDYTRILSRVRTSYFHLTTRLSDGQMFHLMNDDPTGAVTAEKKQAGYDRFLDAFSAYNESPSDESLGLLRDCVVDLRQLDPEFAFQLPGEEDAAR